MQNGTECVRHSAAEAPHAEKALVNARDWQSVEKRHRDNRQRQERSGNDKAHEQRRDVEPAAVNI
jgi:hypothetical protein